MPSKVAMVCME